MGTNIDILPAQEFFVGRGVESATLEHALRAGERLISIIGPSGTGKTRIARQVAFQLVPEWDDAGGVWFCDLTAASKKEDLVSTVAVVLGIPRLEGQSDGDQSLAHALANRGSLLLVLDNFEYLEAEAKELLTNWLRHAPGLQLVVTSLASLGIEGESLFELGPLREDEAIALYEHRASQAWSGERGFSSGEERALGELVSRLDCLPLAIELAAARVRVLPPLEMLARIEERFDLLQSRSGGRQSSLESAIYCSWELLEPEEREVLARASVFTGGFTLEAAEEVLAPDPPTTNGSLPRVLEILESLRDKALLQLDGGDPPRFSLYESMQAFAARELERTGGTADARRRHASYFLRRGEEWAQKSEGPEASEAIAGLMVERENLIAVHRRHLDRDPSIAARAAMAVSVAAARAGSPSAELDLARGAVEAARSADDPILLARALRSHSVALQRQGRLEEGRAGLEEAIDLSERFGARLLEGLLCSNLGSLLVHEGELDQAHAMLQRGFAIEEECKDPSLAGALWMGMSLVADLRGMHNESRRHLEEARDIFAASGNFSNHGRALVNLSQLYLHDGDFEAARAAVREAEISFRRGMELDAEATARLGLGAVERTAGRLVEAEAHLTAALAVLRRFGSRRFEAFALVNLGLIAMEQDQIQLASQRLSDALELIRESGHERTFAQFRPFTGAAKAILGEVEEAKADFDAARSWFEAQGDLANLAVASTLESFLFLAQAGTAARELREEEAAVLVAEAAERIAWSRGPDAPTSHALVTARRLCERLLARRSDLSEAFGRQAMARRGGGGDVTVKEGAEHASTDDVGSRKHSRVSLVIGPNAAWFEVGEGPRIQLGDGTSSCRLLQALIEQHLLAPGVGLGVDRLAEVGWPGEELHPAKASNRVYKGINALRKLGLDELLIRHADGYLLSPHLAVSRSRR